MWKEDNRNVIKYLLPTPVDVEGSTVGSYSLKTVTETVTYYSERDYRIFRLVPMLMVQIVLVSFCCG